MTPAEGTPEHRSAKVTAEHAVVREDVGHVVPEPEGEPDHRDQHGPHAGVGTGRSAVPAVVPPARSRASARQRPVTTAVSSSIVGMTRWNPMPLLLAVAVRSMLRPRLVAAWLPRCSTITGGGLTRGAVAPLLIGCACPEWSRATDVLDVSLRHVCEVGYELGVCAGERGHPADHLADDGPSLRGRPPLHFGLASRTPAR